MKKEYVIAGGAAGALIGAAIMLTKYGKEMNRHLEDSWNRWNSDVKPQIERRKTINLPKGN